MFRWFCLGNEKIVETLLLYGSRINVQEIDKSTPLHIAVQNSMFENDLNDMSQCQIQILILKSLDLTFELNQF